MLHTSTASLYGLPPSTSGAVYAGDPHWVLRAVCPSMQFESPKSKLELATEIE